MSLKLVYMARMFGFGEKDRLFMNFEDNSVRSSSELCNCVMC